MFISLPRIHFLFIPPCFNANFYVPSTYICILDHLTLCIGIHVPWLSNGHMSRDHKSRVLFVWRLSVYTGLLLLCISLTHYFIRIMLLLCISWIFFTNVKLPRGIFFMWLTHFRPLIEVSKLLFLSSAVTSLPSIWLNA